MPTRLRKSLRRLLGARWKIRRAWRLQLYAFWRARPVDPRAVLYESFNGNGALCNPEAIFRGLRADPEFRGFTHIWALSSAEENPAIVREFAGDRSVRFVRPGSSGYYRALATSRYLVSNATFAPEFSKRMPTATTPGQVYLNTWHGTPLKRMGYDIPIAVASRVANVIRNLLAADYLLSANPYMTEHMYAGSHLLANIYGGLVVEEGYPRIDRQFVDAGEAAGIRARLEAAGPAVGDREIVLYAPTWKGESFADPRDDAEELLARVRSLESRLDASRYVVLLKTHQVVHKYAAGRPEFAGRLVPNEIPTNSVLAITDLLVTDYSSIFFDFLATGKPIAFLTPDIADYEGYRGLYIAPEDWPGPITTTTEELAETVADILDHGLDASVEARRRRMQEEFTAKEDGHATERIIDIVFRGRHEGYAVAPIRRDGRETMLVHAGSMRPGRLTNQVLDKLAAIDHDRFDVSVVFPYTRRPATLAQHARLHPAVRQFARVGTMNGTLLQRLGRRLNPHRLAEHPTGPSAASAGFPSTGSGSGSGTRGTDARVTRIWDEEWMRCFGSARFDHVVDFHGRGTYWPHLLLHAPGAYRSLWLHDDRADAAKKAEESSPRQRRALLDLFATYRGYDALVSDTPELASANATGLADYADADAFVWSEGLDQQGYRGAGAGAAAETTPRSEPLAPEG